MLHYDAEARLQLARERAHELAREYRRAQKADAGSADERGAGEQRRGLRRRRWLRRAGGIARVGTTDHSKQSGSVLDGFGKRPNLVKR